MIRKWPLLAAMLLLAIAAVAILWWLREPVDPTGQDRNLVIWGTSDEALMQPLLSAFRETHPSIDIHYAEMDGAGIYKRTEADLTAGRSGADLLISTAMDLQVKLVNDGDALPHLSTNAAALPPWARWRNEIFGISFEPAVMVFNRKVMAGRPIPRSRAELLEAINDDVAFWRGKVGTYDAHRSGTGFLLVSQDTRQASNAGALYGAFGLADAKLAVESGDLLDGLKTGELAVVYNMLASYARREQAKDPALEIVYPSDFTLALMRTVVIPRNAAHPGSAQAFLEFLLSPAGQRIMAEKAGLFAIRQESSTVSFGIAHSGVVRPIPLGVGLLVYIDAHKRRRLLDNWDSLIDRPRP